MMKKNNFPTTLKNPNDITPFANNSRKHSDTHIAQLVNSIKEFGFTAPVIIDEDGAILAGHGRTRAAIEVGLDEVPCIVLEGLTKTQKRAYVIADNKLTDNSEFDGDVLKAEMAALEAEGFDLTLTGFSLGEIQGMRLGGDSGGNTDDDALPEIPEKPTTREGDVWVLGNHRVICADSTDAGAIAVLMNGQKADMVFTDPPYGVNVTGARSEVVKAKKIKQIENDDLKNEDLTTFIVDCLCHDVVKKGASFYVCYDHKTQIEFCTAIDMLGWNRMDTIIWNKNVFGLNGHKGYRPKFEMIAFGVLGEKITWYGDKAQANVWDIARPTERPGNHPTPKPVELIEKALENSSKQDDVVIDYFLGAGSTLIACHKQKRRCYGVELQPEYVDVIVERWQEYTGEQAVHEDGKAYDDLKLERN